jgi:hypothetical protein
MRKFTEGLPVSGSCSEELLNFKHRLGPIDVRQDFPFQYAAEMLKLWIRTVCNFSECQLTREEDKLPAVSGIAKAIQPFFTNGEYLAGLWGDAFLPGLLWFVEGSSMSNGQQSKRPQKYRAPSWSWASIDGGKVVMMYRFNGDFFPHVQIIDVRIDLLTSDPTGQVKDGSLQLFGPLMTVSMAESIYTHGEIDLKIHNVWCPCAKSHPNVVDESNRVVENLHIIPIRGLMDSTDQSYCLLLQPSGLKRGQFKRYGRIFLLWPHYRIHEW